MDSLKTQIMIALKKNFLISKENKKKLLENIEKIPLEAQKIILQHIVENNKNIDSAIQTLLLKHPEKVSELQNKSKSIINEINILAESEEKDDNLYRIEKIIEKI